MAHGFLRLKKRTLLEEMGVTKKYALQSLSMSAVLTAFGLVFLTLYGLAMRSLDFSSFRSDHLIYYTFLSAPLQELLFRGFIQSRLYRLGNPLFAVIITAAIFSLAHFYVGIHLVLFTLPAGLAWGFMMWRRPNILGPMLSHIVLGQYLLQFVV